MPLNLFKKQKPYLFLPVIIVVLKIDKLANKIEITFNKYSSNVIQKAAKPSADQE